MKNYKEFYANLEGKTVSRDQLIACREHYRKGSPEYKNLTAAINTANLSQGKMVTIGKGSKPKRVSGGVSGASDIYNAQEIKNMVFDTLDFKGKWLKTFGMPPPNFCAMIYGMAGNGKSYFTIALAGYLSKFGKVLFIAAEEGASYTLQKKLNETTTDLSNVDIMAVESGKPRIQEAITKHGYKFVIIDSISYLDMDGLDIQKLKENNPTTAFVCVVQCRKDGKYLGAQNIGHVTDANFRVEKGIAYPEKNRFGGSEPFRIFGNTNNDEPMKKNNPVTLNGTVDLKGAEKEEIAETLEAMAEFLLSVARKIEQGKLRGNDLGKVEAMAGDLGVAITRLMKKRIVTAANYATEGKPKNMEYQSKMFKNTWRVAKAGYLRVRDKKTGKLI